MNTFYLPRDTKLLELFNASMQEFICTKTKCSYTLQSKTVTKFVYKEEFNNIQYKIIFHNSEIIQAVHAGKQLPETIETIYYNKNKKNSIYT